MRVGVSLDTVLRRVPSVRHVINARHGSNVEPSLGTRPVGGWGILTPKASKTLSSRTRMCFELPVDVPALAQCLASNTVCGVTTLSYCREMIWKLL